MEPPPRSPDLSNSTEVERFLAFSVSGRTKTKSEFPILISSPEASARSVTGTPLTKVLLRLFKSWILNCPP